MYTIHIEISAYLQQPTTVTSDFTVYIVVTQTLFFRIRQPKMKTRPRPANGRPGPSRQTKKETHMRSARMAAWTTEPNRTEPKEIDQLPRSPFYFHTGNES